jgi:predicted nucleic acid-binding protein
MNLVQADERHLELAAQYLRDAVASQNGSVVDAHILACAWSYDADIWSFDRDFAGTGVASWSTANLMRALAAEDERDET